MKQVQRKAVSATLFLIAIRAVGWAQPGPEPAPPQPALDTPSSLAPDTGKVDALFARGTKHYDLGEYDAAIIAFRQAYALMPDPSFLYNIGQGYRQQGNCREARAAYKSYLRNSPEAPNRAKVTQFIVEMEDCAKREEEKAKLSAPPPPPPPPRHRVLRLAGIATAAGGVLLVGGGLVFNVRASNAASDVEDACRTGCEGNDIAAADRRGRAASRNATILYTTGVAAIAAGTIMFFYAITNERVALTPTAGGAVVSTVVKF